MKLFFFWGLNSFADGRAFLALLNSQKPGLVDMKCVDPENKEENLKRSFKLAEEQFQIPPLLESEDVLNENPDERVIMTYVSQYALYFENPQLQKKNQFRQSQSFQSPSSSILQSKIEQQQQQQKEKEEDEDEPIPIAEVEEFEWDSLRMCGFLLKQDPSGIIKLWRRKWFILQGPRLFFFNKEQTNNFRSLPEAFISLSYAKEVIENKTRKNAFLITTGDIIYNLQADSEKTRNEWMMLLRKAITMWNKQQQQQQKNPDPMKIHLTTIPTAVLTGSLKQKNSPLCNSILFFSSKKNKIKYKRIPFIRKDILKN